MNLGVAFAPLIGTALLWAAIALAGVSALLLLVTRSRGAVIRTLALALIVLALANPSFTREDRDPLSSIAVVVVERVRARVSATARNRPKRHAPRWSRG